MREGITITGTLEPCEICGESLLSKAHVIVPINIEADKKVVALKFCNECFESKQLAIRKSESYSDYLIRLMNAGVRLK